MKSNRSVGMKKNESKPMFDNQYVRSVDDRSRVDEEKRKRMDDDITDRRKEKKRREEKRE